MALSESAPALAVGDKLGSYGIGEVYRAHDTRLRRDVAIKISAAKFSQRFEREARAIAGLNHRHIRAQRAPARGSGDDDLTAAVRRAATAASDRRGARRSGCGAAGGADEEAAGRKRQREEKDMRELRHRNMRTRTATAMALPTAFAPTRSTRGIRLEVRAGAITAARPAKRTVRCVAP